MQNFGFLVLQDVRVRLNLATKEALADLISACPVFMDIDLIGENQLRQNLLEQFPTLTKKEIEHAV